jgi:prepilin-type N-terminal cleavage/methylation domain-containing protein/prepilin-type processing-associated H-X9-DG protein
MAAHGNRHPGFTLIELLFVVAIVAILVGVMLPTLILSKQQARKTACLANLKQLHLAARMYTDDYRIYPAARRARGATAATYWCADFDGTRIDPRTGPLFPYFENPGLLLCPEAAESTAPLDPEHGLACSYGMNAEYVGGDPERADPLAGEPARPEQIADPSLTLLFMDAARDPGPGTLAESFVFWAQYGLSGGTEQEALAHFRHGSLAAGAFCDGHATEVHPGAIADRTLRLGWPAREQCRRK